MRVPRLHGLPCIRLNMILMDGVRNYKSRLGKACEDGRRRLPKIPSAEISKHPHGSQRHKP